MSYVTGSLLLSSEAYRAECSARKIVTASVCASALAMIPDNFLCCPFQ